MAVFLVLAIPFWFLPGARTVIAPLKLFVIGWHELCHMLAVRTGLSAQELRRLTLMSNLGCSFGRKGHEVRPTLDCYQQNVDLILV